MKKEYHYTISRTDRIYLVTFVVVLLAWELVKGFFPGGDGHYDFIPKEKSNTTSKVNYTKKKYKSNYKERTFQRRDKYSNFKKKEFPVSPPPSQPLPVMTCSVNELISMGLSVKVAFNIQKYISSGGVISAPEDLMRIYGMDSIQLGKASPYIIYAPKENKQKEEVHLNNKSREIKIIDLNSATLADLESLPGIGKVLAERIIKFRGSVGGFIDTDQLKDCYGISPELFAQLKPQLIISGSPKMIHINEVDPYTIMHPYLSKKMAKLIKAYRDQHGLFENANELKKVYPADSNWFNKILPYISFDMKNNHLEE